MSDKIAIVYIGDKPIKKDTVTGSRLVFPRHEPVDVETHIAMQLLAFPTVWRKADELDAVLVHQAELEAAAAEEARRAEEAAARLAAEQSMVVAHLGLDLAKMTSAQLATLVEKHNLRIKQGPGERVDEFRLRVRDALRAQQDGE
ncbi:hypothetical protein ACSZND_22485 [Aeromonas hydrophila]|uniref:hypothetical protein n=1 Tax=Aeromonas TaxID=642 RepID=UPI00111A9C96|nr:MULTISPECIES: hypothetical protein [Aeromonas]MBM0511418.1 hypothetical protein [Aeromonas hydrophila]MBW3771004.1 hypothetical protein [Aeromonas hydrophila]MCX4103539.1 hypothetical protein [Aeromonas hydrophila]TNJ17211.1 hypothetical protein CF112_19655 [Aeromonas hydrophila]